jgi:hypothetical protein
MHSHYLYLALDLARERADEANRQRLAALAHRAPDRVTRVRRAVARAALEVARAADQATVDRRARVA